jgi:hypothetical protein
VQISPQRGEICTEFGMHCPPATAPFANSVRISPVSGEIRTRFGFRLPILPGTGPALCGSW